MSVELVLGLTDQLHTFRHGMFRKRIYIGDLDGNRNRRVPQRFGAEATSFGPFAGHINGRIADHEFGVRNGIPHLKTELLFRTQSALVELNRFGRISER